MPRKTHSVAKELILPAAARLAAEVGSRRPAEIQRPIDAYTERLLAMVAHFGYGVEYQAAARLHRVGEDPAITQSYFYRNEHGIPGCVAEAALLMDSARYLSMRDRRRAVVVSPVACAVTYCEAALNSNGQVEGAPEDGMYAIPAQLLAKHLEPFLPFTDEPV